MGCGSCSSGGGCSPKGCKNNGLCDSGDCNKLSTFDWLNDIPEAGAYPKFDLVEVRFKGGRKEFYRNIDNLDLVIGDSVIVDVQGGHHLGFISMTGELARLQMKKKKIKDSDEIRKIYRLASPRDVDKFKTLKDKEGSTLYRGRELIIDLGLKMKLSDVEYQADGNKATFYYSAEGRVDFRELIKILANEFKIRVDMRQISLRQEAGKLGGIGSCGRELCCSTWLTDFKSVSTSAARYQNLSINPAKISGQCGRLKCCLNYELDTYMDAIKDFPDVKKPLKTATGNLKHQKTDIFKRIMWFYQDGVTDWVALDVDQVKNIIELNKKGEVPKELEEIVFEKEEKKEEETVNLENNLDRLDKKLRKQGKSKKKKPSGSRPNKNQPQAKGKKDGEKSTKSNPNSNPKNKEGGQKKKGGNQNRNKNRNKTNNNSSNNKNQGQNQPKGEGNPTKTSSKPSGSSQSNKSEKKD